MAKLATVADIISKFELQVGDTTELSDDDELDLAQQAIDDLYNDRPWEFLRKNTTGTAVTDANGVTTIVVPTDFKYFSTNHQMTANNDDLDDNQERKVVYMGSQYTPFLVVNFSDRRRYFKQAGYCWYDPSTQTITFSVTPLTDTLNYDFDYIYIPPAVSLLSVLPFPAEYWWTIVYAMAVSDVALQLFDRAKSYAAENEAKRQKFLSDLQFYNSSLIHN